MTGADEVGIPGELVRVMNANTPVYITLGTYSKATSFTTWVLWPEGPKRYTRQLEHFVRGGPSLWKP